jgi:mRNA interferase MazF
MKRGEVWWACLPEPTGSGPGLPRPSVINVSQVITIDRSLLTERVTALPQLVMGKVIEGLRLVLPV